MKKIAAKYLPITIVVLFLFASCETPVITDYGNLIIKAKLPEDLEEVSGIQYDANEKAFWMINDSGNSSSVYLVNEKGEMLRKLKIDAKNRDWEDIAQDSVGNLYIGDFGNNRNNRKNLQIYKINKIDLICEEKIDVQKIKFSFPEQKEFPPKRKYYDVESFFEWKGNFYIFTKSHVKNQIGRTFLYRVPNKKGKHEAELISDFMACLEDFCWITAADISKDGKKVVIINNKSAWTFTDFESDDFFSGNCQEYSFDFLTQMESVTFKDSLLYVADEEHRKGYKGRYLYNLPMKD